MRYGLAPEGDESSATMSLLRSGLFPTTLFNEQYCLLEL